MHYAWQLAHGEIKAKDIPNNARVYIIWDHGNEEASRKAADEMIRKKGFDMAHIAKKNSNHIDGLAIDMKITWSGTLKIRKPNKQLVEITGGPRNGTNKELARIGKLYGVHKLVNDPPHWSFNGK